MRHLVVDWAISKDVDLYKLGSIDKKIDWLLYENKMQSIKQANISRENGRWLKWTDGEILLISELANSKK